MSAALVYMWVAFYNYGQALPQFDFQNGKENPFSSIDQSKLIKFGLYPINPDLALKINQQTGQNTVISKNNIPYYPMKINPDQRLIFVRRNAIMKFSFQVCGKCGYKWQWMPNHKEGIGEAGLPIHGDYILQQYQAKTFPCAKCPKCGSFNAILCPTCNTLINEMKRPNSEEHFFECPKCKTEHVRYIKMYESGKHSIIYLLGYQMTVEGKNYKYIMFIDDKGEFEISDNYNYK